MKFLIVDDNPQMREMMRGFLPESNNDDDVVVREISDGAFALAAYRDFLPDFVLMDWQMNQMNGLAATKEILKSFPDAHILLVTQFDDKELRSAAHEAGVIGFVVKDDLKALRSFLQKHF